MGEQENRGWVTKQFVSRSVGSNARVLRNEAFAQEGVLWVSGRTGGRIECREQRVWSSRKPSTVVCARSLPPTLVEQHSREAVCRAR